MKVEVQVSGAHAGGARIGGGRSSDGNRTTRAGDEGAGGGYDGVPAWLMAIADEDVFRKIVGYV